MKTGRLQPPFEWRTSTMYAKLPDDPQPYNTCSCGRPADGIDARHDRPSCRQCARLIADGGRDLTDDDVEADEEIAKEQPINYRHWPRHAKVSYLINSYGRAELLAAIRHKIESDESTDRLHKHELAAVTLAMRLQL